MSRKRKSDQPTTDTEAATNTATVEIAPAENDQETPTFVERVGGKTERVLTPDPYEIAGDYAAGVRLFESKRDQQVAIKFDSKPGQKVIDRLKDAGYRWNSADRIWAHPVRPESAMGIRIDAERLYQEVRQMVRQDKGVEAEQKTPF